MELQVFNSTEFGSVRTATVNGEVMFVGKDVADILGYQNGSRDINRHVDEEDRHKVMIFDGNQDKETIIINESGLYSLILSSKMPNAKKFKHWVTSEVLPAIRKHGMYAIDEILENPDLAIAALTQLKEERERRKQLECLALVQRQQIAEMQPKASYLVKDILKYSAEDLLTEVIIPNGWATDKVATKNISLLHTRLVTDEIINYFEVEKDSIDSVLDIFVRVNSGGTVLSKSDLLFSTIVSHWDKARDEIDKLLSEINKKGEGFKFSNDFIMRTCLYLLDMSVALKVETFKKDSVLKIKENWDAIRKAIKDTVDLLNEFGFNSENMISYVAVSPMVYYRYKGGNFDSSSKAELRKYIVIAQVRQIFGTASNSALTSIREALKAAPANSFSMANLNAVRFTGDRSLRYTADEIDSMFDTYEIGAYTFMLLSLLYPNLKYSQKGFHQDHMHPYTGFEESKINGLVLPDGTVIDDDTKEDWRRRRNTLANLQLLEGRENESKNATPLVDWLKITENSENAKYLPGDISYELSNFEEFMEKRQELMSKALKDILL